MDPEADVRSGDYSGIVADRFLVTGGIPSELLELEKAVIDRVSLRAEAAVEVILTCA